MKVRFLGDGDVDEDGVGKPCTVFGHTFPVMEWVDVPNSLKLIGNPMFDVETDEGSTYERFTVPELKTLAADRGVDLTDLKKKGDIIAALQLAEEEAGA